MNYIEAAETFGDVYIQPKKSDIPTRSDINISTVLKSFKLTLPVISANMKDITGPKMAFEMSKNGGLGILHRFNTIDQAVADYKEFFDILSTVAEKDKIYTWPGVSIGVQEEDKERFQALYDAGARIFCIDVSHGHHTNVHDMLRWINNELFLWDRSSRGQVCLIAGNIATAEAAYDLAEWGADVVKVGIGPGRVCQTRQRTGVGVPQLYAIRDVYEEIQRQHLDIKIIADGGITSSGDVAKALKYADAVMVGSVLAGTSETPGNVYPEPGTNLVNRQYYKVYGGSASMENKVSNGEKSRFVEGEMIKVPFKGHVKYILREIEDGVRSAFSFVGAYCLKEFRDNCELHLMSTSGRIESKI